MYIVNDCREPTPPQNVIFATGDCFIFPVSKCCLNPEARVSQTNTRLHACSYVVTLF